MQKTLLCLLALCLAAAAPAQTITAKKGKINAGDSTIAKYDSKGGIFRAYNIHIKSLTDEPMIDLKEEGYDFESPFADRRGWYRISFPNSDLPMLRYRMREQLNEKMIFNQVLFPETASFLLRDGRLNREVVSAVAGGPNAYNFEADSAKVRQLEAENAARIKKIIARDLSAAFELKQVNVSYQNPNTGSGENTVTYDIIQQGFYLGRVTKRSYYYNGAMHYDYGISMKTAAFDFGGTQTEYSPVAFFTDANPAFDNKVILMKDKSKLKFKTPNPAGAEWSFVKFIIDSGNL